MKTEITVTTTIKNEIKVTDEDLIRALAYH